MTINKKPKEPLMYKNFGNNPIARFLRILLPFTILVASIILFAFRETDSIWDWDDHLSVLVILAALVDLYFSAADWYHYGVKRTEEDDWNITYVRNAIVLLPGVIILLFFIVGLPPLHG
ncbi:hypothetical protein [Ruegeria arenilitoris]|uniref:hypothetical protein n=1 Tax=Ruegeria arenilitoris TaxID=1173585 RepID=UPI00147D2488|nr:hypothetical protein [Ruegeria arenilitoris]